MKIASERRYEVSASFSAIGSSPRSAAIAGSEVEITVPSRFSMKRAQATMSGVRMFAGTGLGQVGWVPG
jgi:hypothetical protein